MALSVHNLAVLFFYGCDKTPQPRQFTEESIYLGLWFKRVRVHDGRGSSRWETWWLEQQLRVHVLNHRDQREGAGDGA